MLDSRRTTEDRAHAWPQPQIRQSQPPLPTRTAAPRRTAPHFYRLVGAHGYEKTEQAYERLGEHLNRARRAHIISMDAIRDDGGTIIKPHCWSSAKEFLETFRGAARRFTLDRSVGQKTRLLP